MSSALWVSKTGLQAQDTALRVISNNLANVTTVGFKRDRAVFSDLMYQIAQQPGGLSTQDTQLPSGTQLGVGVKVMGTQKNFSEGSMQNTNAPLDLAGWSLDDASATPGIFDLSAAGLFAVKAMARIAETVPDTNSPPAQAPE